MVVCGEALVAGSLPFFLKGLKPFYHLMSKNRESAEGKSAGDDYRTYPGI